MASTATVYAAIEVSTPNLNFFDPDKLTLALKTYIVLGWDPFLPSTVMRWCVFVIDWLMASISSGRIDLRFIISHEIPSFASSSAASTQKWTPIEWAANVMSLPTRCTLACF